MRPTASPPELVDNAGPKEKQGDKDVNLPGFLNLPTETTRIVPVALMMLMDAIMDAPGVEMLVDHVKETSREVGP